MEENRVFRGSKWWDSHLTANRITIAIAQVQRTKCQFTSSYDRILRSRFIFQTFYHVQCREQFKRMQPMVEYVA
jgi:hypothetical protein